MSNSGGGGSRHAGARHRVLFAALTAVVAVLVAMVVAVPAWADITITIDDQQPQGSTENGPTYDWYVMMWASVAEGQQGQENAISYHVDKQTLATALGNLHLTDDGWSTTAPGDGDKKLFTVTQVNDQNYWTVVINNKTDAVTDDQGNETTAAVAYTGEEVAAALNAVVSGKTGTELDSVTEQHGSIAASTDEEKKFSIKDNGYVLITSSLGSKLVLDSFQNKTVNEKNEYPTVTKKQSKTQDGTYTTNDINAEVGKTVYYQLEIPVPETATKSITVNDTISKGLTLNTTSGSVSITGVTVDGTEATFDGQTTPVGKTYSWTDVTETPAPADGSKTYSFDIPADVVSLVATKAHETTNAGGTIDHHPATITIRYTATVNEDAVMQSPWNTNESYIKYDNYTSVHSQVTTRVFKFDLVKHIESETGEVLPGVKFTLTRTGTGADSGTTYYYTAPSSSDDNAEARFAALGEGENVDAKKQTTDNDGKITFSGLEAGTYTLTETDTVSGYRGLSTPITITVSAEGTISSNSLNQTVNGSRIGSINDAGDVIIVINQRGSVLPSTGGAGTVAFYVVGGALMAGAVIFAVSRRRAAGK